MSLHVTEKTVCCRTMSSAIANQLRKSASNQDADIHCESCQSMNTFPRVQVQYTSFKRNTACILCH